MSGLAHYRRGSGDSSRVGIVPAYNPRSALAGMTEDYCSGEASSLISASHTYTPCSRTAWFSRSLALCRPCADMSVEMRCPWASCTLQAQAAWLSCCVVLWYPYADMSVEMRCPWASCAMLAQAAWLSRSVALWYTFCRYVGGNAAEGLVGVLRAAGTSSLALSQCGLVVYFLPICRWKCGGRPRGRLARCRHKQLGSLAVWLCGILFADMLVEMRLEASPLQ